MDIFDYLACPFRVEADVFQTNLFACKAITIILRKGENPKEEKPR